MKNDKKEISFESAQVEIAENKKDHSQLLENSNCKFSINLHLSKIFLFPDDVSELQDFLQISLKVDEANAISEELDTKMFYKIVSRGPDSDSKDKSRVSF